ncbi:WD repeat, SAM and U-box domain-containing protein 1 [Armadillidium vulgare]|nr:WD repeat, SAM and U-box domain-containing protein 1 [Armadillidium vulgare]
MSFVRSSAFFLPAVNTSLVTFLSDASIHKKTMSNRRNVLENKDKEKLKPAFTLKHHSNDVTSVDFTVRNLLATGSSGHRYGINCICFSPYGTKLASASTDGQTFIWDVKTGENLCSLYLSGESAGVRTCAFSPNSALLATGGDGDTAVVWDVSTLSPIREIIGHESTVTSVAFTPDSNFLATGSSSGELKIWDGMYGHALPLVSKVEVHDLGITCLHFSPSLGKEESIMLSKQYLLSSGGQDNDLHLWIVNVGGQKPLDAAAKLEDSQTATVRLHHSLCGHRAPVMTVRFSASGLLLASASGDKTVRLWDVVKLVPIAVLEGHKRYVTSCAFSLDGDLIAAGGGDRLTHIWRVSDVTDQNFSSVSNIGPQTRRFLNKFPSQKYRENKKLINWSVTEVCEWLGEQGLGEYSPNFRAHAIDGREAVTLTDVILESKLGVEALGHRNKIMRFIRKNSKETSDSVDSNSIPSEFLCPITQETMKNPVLCADGFSYEREALEAWLASGKKTSPMTNEKLSHLILTPNHTLRNLIQRYNEENT